MAFGVAGIAGCGQPADGRSRRRVVGTIDNPVIRENALPGSTNWKKRSPKFHPADDVRRQIQGYASATSVNVGESIDFHVSVARAQTYTIEVYRLGHYSGAGGRLMTRRGPVRGKPRPVPPVDQRTGVIACDWPVSWTLDVPRNWTSGVFLAIFIAADGHYSSTPFVVRNDRRRSDFLTILPFTTYQAYNMWPRDGRTGKNLYKGYRSEDQMNAEERAVGVSFDRPYSGAGRPSWFTLDAAAVRWAERQGFDVAYATSVDLHEGRVHPERHVGLLFPGHDEYWSQPMRKVTERAVAGGTHVAFFAANNVYWHIRLDAAADGRLGRVVTCYKGFPDPAADGVGPTVRWREVADGSRPEQQLLGVQFSGMPRTPVPLVVRQSRHWLWKGAGVRDGDKIPGLVAVEADGHHAGIDLIRPARQTLLSASPYRDRGDRGDCVQHTSLYQTDRGAMVFAAGTFHWPLALVKSDYTDKRVQRATKNLLNRMLSTSAH